VPVEKQGNGFAVGKVKFVNVGKNKMVVRVFFGSVFNFGTQLSVAAGN
jgi:hypothetical protein